MSKSVLVEFVSSSSDEELRFLNSRLTERLQGDIAEVLDFLSNNKTVDSILAAAKSADEVYSICDTLTECVQKEYKKRGVQTDKK